MDSPTAIASYFLGKAISTGIHLTPMKMIKLVYIAHGWHLGFYRRPLISERVQAWKYGPVIETLYHHFKRYGAKPIESYEADLLPRVHFSAAVPLLDRVWEVYSKYTGAQLSTMTHQQDTPWYEVWYRRGGQNESRATIPDDLICEHYRQKIDSQRAQGTSTGTTGAGSAN